MIQVASDLTRVEQLLIDGHRKIGRSSVEYFCETGFCQPSIKSVNKNVKIIGSVFALKIVGKIRAVINKVYEFAKLGNVLVIEGGKGNYYAFAGEFSTIKSINLRIFGLVVDGYVTNCLEIEKLWLPSYS